MPFNRFLPPQCKFQYNIFRNIYIFSLIDGDGVDSIRTSAEGGPLSSSRFVSLVVHGDKDTDASVTLMLAQWGQLVDHDITSTLQPRYIYKTKYPLKINQYYSTEL